MSEKQRVKKPIWKKWWVWVIAVLLLIGIFSAGNDDEEPIAEPVEEEVVEEEPEAEEEPVLSEDDVQTIASNFETHFEEEKELMGDEYRLHNIEFDADENQLNIMIDYQLDPVLSADDLIETNEDWTWQVAEAMPGISDKNFNIRVSAVTETGDDELIFWGSTRYISDSGEYTFRDGPGMEILD